MLGLRLGTVLCVANVLLAISVRLPSCGESLWVDELHTAWVVAGDLSEVSHRAAMGNQSPWYFWVLWFWSQFASSNEVALRFPSLVAVSISAGLLTWCGWRATQSWLCGWLGGSFLAVESSSIYFGTEARSYSLIIFTMTMLLAVLLRFEVHQQVSRRWFVTLGFVSAAAILFHITAALTVVVLASCNAMLGKMTWGKRLSIAFSIGGGVLPGILLTLPVTADAWDARKNWDVFGRTNSIFDLLEMWPVYVLFAVPLGISIIFFIASKSFNIADLWMRPLGVVSLTVVLVTCAVWLSSYLGIASLWHRRYIISLMPMVCIAGAFLWKPILAHLHARVALCVAVLAVSALMVSQGSLQPLLYGRIQLVHRGEAWRGAMLYLRRHIEKGDRVFVAAELIESKWLDLASRDALQLSSDQLEYLLYPVEGIYELDGAQPLGLVGLRSTAKAIEDIYSTTPGHLWILVRAPRLRVERAMANLKVNKDHIRFLPFEKLTLVRLDGGG